MERRDRGNIEHTALKTQQHVLRRYQRQTNNKKMQEAAEAEVVTR